MEDASTRKPVLLTVDDDPAVSRSVARDLRRRYGDAYRVVRADSGPLALDALRELRLRGDQVAVLLADHRMPEMTGIEFLEQAMDIYPQARRVLLTAYADTDVAIDAVNVVDLDHYLLKPWDPPEEKFYPVLDAQLEAWTAHPPKAVHETKVVGHRWSARSSEVREFLARNQVPYRWYASDSPEGRVLLDVAGADDATLPVVVTTQGERARRTQRRRAGRAGRPVGEPVGTVLRPGRHRRRPGGAQRRAVRRLRGPAHRAGRADRHGRAGRAELAHRELPRLPRRRLRRPADRAGPSAGAEVRRRDRHDPRRRRRSRCAARRGRCGSTTAARSTRTP